MRKLMAVLCAGLLLCFVAGTLVAAAAGGGDAMSAQGKITAIDAAKKTFTGANDQGTMDFAVTADTKITVDGVAKAFADLKVGQSITVTYTQGADPAPAVTIAVTSAAAGTPPAADGGKRQRPGGGGRGGGGGGAAGAGQGQAAQGKITEIDAAKKTFTGASPRGSTMTFAVTDATKITDKDGKAMTFADLQVGQNIQVTYTQGADPAPALTVTIMPAGAGGGAGGGRQRPGGGGGGGGGAPQD